MALIDQIRGALSIFRSEHGLPASFGQYGGEFSILIGVIIFDPKYASSCDFSEAKQDHLLIMHSKHPLQARDPFGYFFSHHTITNSDTFFRDTNWLVKLSSNVNPGFQFFLEHQFDLLIKFYQQNQSDFDNKSKIRSSIINRVRSIARILEIDIFDKSRSPREQFCEVVKRVDDSYNLERSRTTPVFPQKWFNGLITIDQIGTRASPTVLSRLAARAGISRPWEKRVNGFLEKTNYDDDGEVIELCNQQIQLQSKERIQAIQRGHSTRWDRSQSRKYPCSMTLPRGLSKAELVKIITKVSKLEEPEDVVLAMMIFGLCNFQYLLKSKIIKTYATFYCILTPINKSPQNEPIESKELYCKRINHVIRLVPSKLAEAYLTLLDNPDELQKMIQTASQRLHNIHPEASISKLAFALAYHGPAWFGYSYILALWGLFPKRRKVEAPLSYTYCSGKLIASTHDFLRFFDVNLQKPSFKEAEDFGCGSALMPKKKVVREFHRVWKKYLLTPYDDDPFKAMVHWNIICAGLHLYFLLLCGVRNHSMAPLPSSIFRNSIFLLQQKGIETPIYVPKVFRSLLERVRAKWNLLPSSTRYNFDPYAYCFLGLDKHGQITSVNSSHDSIADALQCAEEMRKFALLDRKWTRHFSNTVLRELGFAELEVQAFHGHHIDGLHPVRRHRLEMLVSVESRERMANELAKEIGII